MQKAYIYVGGIFSVFYLIIGLFMATGRVSLAPFGISQTVSSLIGAVVIAYGIFRAIMFFKRYKAIKRGEG